MSHLKWILACKDFPLVSSLTRWRIKGVTSLPVTPFELQIYKWKCYKCLCYMWQLVCPGIIFLYLASVTAVCMASSICCPVAACSSGMGTANRRPLCSPRDSVLAVEKRESLRALHECRMSYIRENIIYDLRFN